MKRFLAGNEFSLCVFCKFIGKFSKCDVAGISRNKINIGMLIFICLGFYIQYECDFLYNNESYIEIHIPPR